MATSFANPAHDGLDGLTYWLRRAESGDRQAVDEIFTAAFQQLRMLARARLRSAGPHSLLNTGSLVNEFYLRFAASGRARIEDREHFLRYAARAMRSVIVDSVRRRIAWRRGGGEQAVTLTTRIAAPSPSGEDEILSVHEALDKLAKLDPRLAQVVEMRYFAGLSEEEIASALNVTARTVRRDWEKARLLLSAALRRPR